MQEKSRPDHREPALLTSIAKGGATRLRRASPRLRLRLSCVFTALPSHFFLIPVAAIDIVTGLPDALVTTFRVAVLVPTSAGLKKTAMVQL